MYARTVIIVLAISESGFCLASSEDFYLSINQSAFMPLVNEYSSACFSPCKEQRISRCTLLTESGVAVPIVFYDRASDVLLIVAPALPASKENMDVFAQLFSSYDVVTFDYRWGGQYMYYLFVSMLAGRPIKRVLLDPLEELAAVVQYAAQSKCYKKIIGLGECYSCFHLAKLQSDAIKEHGVGPFTHLILDSCWHSLRDFAERVCFDPFLPLNSRDGGAPTVLKLVTNSAWFKYIVLGAAFSVINDVFVGQYIPMVCIPILFIHGMQDLFVPLEHFNKVWSAADKDNRAALLTPYKHVDNLGNKKLYRYIVQQFVASQVMHDFEQRMFVRS